MNKKALTQSVIKKIQMAKLLFDLGTDHFRISENPEKIGAGIILLQDSVEVFLIAVCEHLGVQFKNSDYIKFYEYFTKLKEHTKEEIPLEKQMLKINRQRINVKHHATVPRYDDCDTFPNDARNFFVELSSRYLNTNFDSVTLVDLLKDGEVKELLKQAEVYLKERKYKECQVNCRKALYLTYEINFDVRPFEDEKKGLLAILRGNYIPYYAQNKKYIEEHVKNSTDYIVISIDRLEKDLLVDGIMPVDFFNVWRLTPKMYYYDDEKEWVVKDEFNDEMYNEENAEYCFRKTVEILLLKQRRREQAKYVDLKFQSIKVKRQEVNVFEKASLKSTIQFKGDLSVVKIMEKVRGLDDKKQYYRIIDEIEKEGKKFFVSGYVCGDDVEEVF